MLLENNYELEYNKIWKIVCSCGIETPSSLRIW